MCVCRRRRREGGRTAHHMTSCAHIERKHATVLVVTHTHLGVNKSVEGAGKKRKEDEGVCVRGTSGRMAEGESDTRQRKVRASGCA